MRRIPPIGLFCALFAASILLWWRPIAATLALAIHNDEYTHILIIVPVAAALVFLQRRSLKISSKVEWLSGTLFALAIAIFVLDTTGAFPQGYRLTLLIFALVLWWMASFALSFGWSAFRRVLFPLCFLFWIVPWPGDFLNYVVTLLQNYSASLTRVFFEIFGIPVLQQGVHLSIPGLNIEVAAECSSIRSSLILLVTSMLLAYICLRPNWKRTLVVLAAIPLSVFKNGVRIFTLAMLGVHVDPGFLTGRLHHEGGIVFFALALVILWVFVRLLERGESPSPPRSLPVRIAETSR